MARAPGVEWWTSGTVDFGATAHVIDQLDLVVSSDCSVAHLAGALGAPVWVLLTAVADDRWTPPPEADTALYRSARLFRQPKAGDWPDVMARVREELAQLAQSPKEIPV